MTTEEANTWRTVNKKAKDAAQFLTSTIATAAGVRIIKLEGGNAVAIAFRGSERQIAELAGAATAIYFNQSFHFFPDKEGECQSPHEFFNVSME